LSRCLKLYPEQDEFWDLSVIQENPHRRLIQQARASSHRAARKREIMTRSLTRIGAVGIAVRPQRFG
jgi:hypothetical protein